MRAPLFWPCCPGAYARRSTGHLSVKHFSPLRNSFSPSRRQWRHLSRFLAIPYLLDAAALGRPATVVRNRRHVGDAADLETDGVQRAHRGLAAGARALDAHFDVLHAAFLRRAAAALGRDLRGERRRLARALEAGVPRGRPGERIALAIGDGDDGVVEGRVDVRDAFRDVFLDLLARPRGGGLLELLARRCIAACHCLYPFTLPCRLER